jgi:hypothetical protein
MKWRWCSDSENISELELEGGHGSLRLLNLRLGGGDALLKDCEGSGEVGWSGGGS